MVNKGMIVATLVWAVIITMIAIAVNIYTLPKETAKINVICNNKTGLEDTVKCLNKELLTFYNYNLTNLNEKMTEEELKSKGGVCWHYAEWYSNQLKTMGYYTETYAMRTPETGHRIATAWDKELKTYCILDQTEIKCTKLN